MRAQISKIGMMANKDVRPLLSAMSANSIISLQEVPKSADRNPTRMFYLWYASPSNPLCDMELMWIRAGMLTYKRRTQPS